MKLTDLNPRGGIGANSVLLELGPFRLVIDSGMNPKLMGTEALPKIEHTRSKPVDLVLLTHCHLDHLGTIPVLMREHPEAILILSPASKLLARRMLHNSCNVMMRQKEEHGVDAYPLFTRGEVERLNQRSFALPCNHPRFFSSDDGQRLSITFHHAGHIPGAVGITLEYNHQRIFHTGDVLFTDQRILKGANFPRHRVDTMVLETTRGMTGRASGKSREEEIDRLLTTINATLHAGGSVLVPAFALGRMQELLAVFRDARRAGKLTAAPIYSSGLGMDLANYFDEIAEKTPEVSFDRRILKELNVTRMPDGMKAGRPPKQPGIYLLSSGMVVENTPSYLAAASLLSDPSATICFVGYCDPEAPGGTILAAEPEADVLFSALQHTGIRRAKIEKFDLSSHADREELLEFALACTPRTVVLTHGDADARAWFQDAFKEAAPGIRVIDPEPLQSYSLA